MTYTVTMRIFLCIITFHFRNLTLFSIWSQKKNVLLNVPYPPGLVGGPFLVINYAQKQRDSHFFVLLAYWLGQMPFKNL